MTVHVVHHFSEDPSIERFEPHIPKTNPTQDPAVWAIDTEHAPLYWFPRDCPRATAWPSSEPEREQFQQAFATDAPRVHAIEWAWLERMRSTTLWRYDFDARSFQPWEEATGQWISHSVVEPIERTAVRNLLEVHRDADIELRLVPTLWPIVGLMTTDRWQFSHVRLSNAAPKRRRMK